MNLKKIFGIFTILTIITIIFGEAGITLYKKTIASQEQWQCRRNSYVSCPANCAVCPPCQACSAITCNSKAFCSSTGFDSKWYEQIKKTAVEKQKLIDEKPTEVLPSPTAPPQSIYTDKYEAEIRRISTDVMTGLKYKSFSRVAKYVDDRYLLLISSSYAPGNWDSNSEKKYPRRLTKVQTQNFFLDNTEYFWGYGDGNGFPIEETDAQYFKRVFDKDYSAAKIVSYNKTVSNGNNMNIEYFIGDLVKTQNPLRFIEYYIPATEPTDENLDWGSLAFVYVQDSGNWYLVAILHNQWAI